MSEGGTFSYARAHDGAYIGFRVDGAGPIDIVWQPDRPGNIDLEWEDPLIGPLLDRLSRMRARVRAHAGSSEVLVFEDAGEHELKGVPDRWRRYRVVDG